MAWTNLSFPFGSTLSSTQMTQMDDNFDAVMAKASGAPVLANGYVVTAMIANSQVTTNKIESAEQMTTANVIAATAGASVGSVGTYAFLSYGSTINPGSTQPGAALVYSDTSATGGTSPSGTWRAMGAILATGGRATLWLRIS